MKVRVSVHARFHAFEMARGLHERGLLESLHTTYPAFIARSFVGPSVTLRTAPLLELRRRLYDRLRLGSKPDLAIAGAFGRFAAGGLAGCRADILTGWSSATLEAIPVAQAMGMKVVIERCSTHISHQTEVLTDEYKRYGMQFRATAPGIIERELAEYEQADAIAVPTGFAADTFRKRGTPESKLIVAPYGVDLQRFSPAADNHQNRPPRILFVGSIGLRKGVPSLLRAFATLKGAAELHLVGPVDAEFSSILAGLPLDNVVLTGPVSGKNMPKCFADADIFCLPSLEEGFSYAALQAMASGLPAVFSHATVDAGLVTHGKNGMIVPAGDEASLAAALNELVSDGGRRRDMGRAARERVLDGYGWDDYIDRLSPAYERLLV